MDFDRESGHLVKRTDALGAFEAVVTRARSKFMGIPSKCKQQIPHLSNKDVLIIDKIVRESLLELSNVDSAD
jgi:phage terminase Nu1 subunit (DNA packaging protein)